MDQPDDSPVKVKKHKKHKKSKKAAITLDEFLSMNQDVFGEGLDFQGIEEVPTRVVKNQLKIKKKNPTNSVTLSDLEKLKNAGIVVKKKVAQNPVVKNLQVISRPVKSDIKMLKVNTEKELTTSSAVLTKLMNQSNNQIKIIKKSSGESIKKDQNVKNGDNIEEGEKHCADTDKSNYSEAEPGTSSQTNAAIPENVHSPDNEDQVKDKSLCSSPILTGKTPENTLSDKDESSINQNHEGDPNEFDTPKIRITEKSPEIHQEAEIRSPKGESQVLEKSDEEMNKNEPQHSDSELAEKNDAVESEKNHENDPDSDENQEAIDKNEQPNINNSASASLSKLQQLSHLITVKPVSQNKMTTPVEHDKSPQAPSSKAIPQMISPNEKSNVIKPKAQVEKDPTTDALKILSKNITVKSLSTKRSLAENECENNQFDEAEGSSNIKAQNVLIKKIKVENGETDKGIIKAPICPGTANANKSAVAMKPNRTIVKNENDSVKSNNANILKRLTGITSKSISNKKVNNNPQPVKQPEIIEIFDVDDSEDEVENDNNSKVEHSQNSASSMDALKNLSKNITVKSNRPSPMTKNMKLMNDIKVEKQNEDSSSNYKEDSNVEALINIQNRNMAHVLKGLCKNITIKQGNSTKSVATPDITQETNVPEDNATSDSDSYQGNVKITEMEQDMTDNEDNPETVEHPSTQHDDPIVETPYDSCSDKEEMEEYDEQQDFESEIKASTVQKSQETYSSSVNSVCLNNLRNISKNLTIKPLNQSSLNTEENSKTVQTLERFVNSQKKQLPTKFNKQTMREFKGDNLANHKNLKDSSQYGDTTTNLMHQKVMNQVNTVNKEVTVKTFQTKTVIQEITTTVTKTIKTVNQTVKQELRTNYQTNGPVVPQKVLGVRPNQPKSLQGVVVRHAAPGVGIKTNNTLSQIRAAGTVVRPSKQNVPMRTGNYSPRPNLSRTSVGKQVANPTNINPTVGKSVKISPTAMVSGITKRPNTEDVSGPFSCFKKPKESLIPVSDIPSFTSSGDSPSHFSAASHTSSSNVTNTKIVKGNSVVTAKQVKSQVNTSQQFSRVNNNTGLKIMSSQAKQTQVQEKSETSSMNRTTLEAIQKLQKQGLLVKKPRSDVNDSSRSSNHEGDDSADETDE